MVTGQPSLIIQISLKEISQHTLKIRARSALTDTFLHLHPSSTTMINITPKNVS